MVLIVPSLVTSYKQWNKTSYCCQGCIAAKKKKNHPNQVHFHSYKFVKQTQWRQTCSQLMNSVSGRWSFLFWNVFLSLGACWKCFLDCPRHLQTLFPFPWSFFWRWDLKEHRLSRGHSLLPENQMYREPSLPHSLMCASVDHTLMLLLKALGCLTTHGPVYPPEPFGCFLLSSRLSPLPWITCVHAGIFFFLSWDRRLCSSHLWA